MPRAKKRANVNSSAEANLESKRKTPKLTENNDTYDFTREKSYTDLVLQVDGKRLHVSRSLLMMASPVFQTMFESDFCEKSKNCIDLPEKNFDDVHLLLQFLIPGSSKTLTYDDAMKIYPLAHEYQIEEIKNRCVEVLVNTAENRSLTSDQFAEWYSFAARYGLEPLQMAMTKRLTKLDTDIMEAVANTDIDMVMPWSVCRSFLKALAGDREKLREHEEVQSLVSDLFSEHTDHCRSRHMTCCQHKCEPVSMWVHPNLPSTKMTPQCWQQIVYTLMQSQVFTKWFDKFSDIS